MRRNESHFWAEEIVIQMEEDALPPEISGAFLYHGKVLRTCLVIGKRSARMRRVCPLAKQDSYLSRSVNAPFFRSECHEAPDLGKGKSR